MERMILEHKKICCVCGSDKTRKQKNGRYDSWYRINGEYICHNCASKQYRNTNRRYREIRFRGKIIALSFKIKTGICSQCHKKGVTQMHHYMGYWIIFPWFGTIELCLSCHTKSAKRGWHGYLLKEKV